VSCSRQRKQAAETVLRFLQRAFGALARRHVFRQALVGALQVGGAGVYQQLHAARALHQRVHEGRRQGAEQQAAQQGAERAKVVGQEGARQIIAADMPGPAQHVEAAHFAAVVVEVQPAMQPVFLAVGRQRATAVGQGAVFRRVAGIHAQPQAGVVQQAVLLQDGVHQVRRTDHRCRVAHPGGMALVTGAGRHAGAVHRHDHDEAVVLCRVLRQLELLGGRGAAAVQDPVDGAAHLHVIAGIQAQRRFVAAHRLQVFNHVVIRPLRRRHGFAVGRQLADLEAGKARLHGRFECGPLGLRQHTVVIESLDERVAPQQRFGERVELLAADRLHRAEQLIDHVQDFFSVGQPALDGGHARIGALLEAQFHLAEFEGADGNEKNGGGRQACAQRDCGCTVVRESPAPACHGVLYFKKCSLSQFTWLWGNGP
jgi:hypothetical protein